MVVSARANSVSYTDEVPEMLNLLQRDFTRNNLLLIFPEQFGEAAPLTSFVDPMATDVARTASPRWRKLRDAVCRLFHH